MRIQERFGLNDHDSLQYHFRCGPLIGAARLFFTKTLSHASLWVYDNSLLSRLHDSNAPLKQNTGEALDVSNGFIRFSDGSEGVRITLGDQFAVTLRPRHDYRWGDTISNVIHQPDMVCDLSMGGRLRTGIGYCKRYAWTPAPRHWGYRFVQGWTDDGAALWTADANFGNAKYDYFCLLEPDGTLHEGMPDGGRHRQDVAIGELAAGQARASLRELAVWETPLLSGGMDSLLRQRVCRLELNTPGGLRDGLVINETCYGTLG